MTLSSRGAIRYLLDTDAFVRAYQGMLSVGVQQRLSDPDDERILSAVSLVEVAVRNSIGKLDMPEAETRQALRDLRMIVLPLEEQHVLRMFSLPLHHRDPFDRMILAVALEEKLPIVTGDRIFRLYSGVKVIW